MSKLRYQKSTTHSECDEDLLDTLDASTLDSLNEGLFVSPTFANASQMSTEALEKLMAEDSPWFSLDVVAHIIEGDLRRKLDGSVQVPSVLLKIQGDSITYVSCEACMKSVAPKKTCSCSTTSTTLRFKAQLRLEDDTCELKTTCFDATKDIVEIFADGDEGKLQPAYYHENAVSVEDLRMAIEAIPFTVLLTFADSEYSERIEISIKAADRTFHASKSLLRHPRKAILRVK